MDTSLLLGMYLGLGSKRLWTTSEGRQAHAFMAAWVSPDLRIGAAGLDKIVFMVDIATATNWFASEGVAIGLYFTPAIAIKTGPVFFRDREHYERLGIGSSVWSVQLDVDVDLTRPRGSATEAAHPASGAGAAAAPETGPAQTVTPP